MIKESGHWAASVINNIAKTMLSTDLKEYNKENKKMIIFQKLKEVYSDEEMKKILDKALEIDYGEHNCEIFVKGAATPRRGKKIANSYSADDMVER